MKKLNAAAKHDLYYRQKVYIRQIIRGVSHEGRKAAWYTLFAHAYNWVCKHTLGVQCHC